MKFNSNLKALLILFFLFINSVSFAQSTTVVSLNEAIILAKANNSKVKIASQEILTDENISARKVFQEVQSKLKIEKSRARASKTKLQTLNVSPNAKGGTIPILSL